MAEDSTEHDVVIVGAGVIGCAIARELASNHEVLVIEKGQVAGETTAKASGLTTIEAGLPEYPNAARYAKEFFAEYDGRDDFEVHYHDGVGLVKPGAREWARNETDRLQTNGVDVTYRSAEELKERYPGVFVLDEFVGGMEFPDLGWVEPYTYAMALKEDAEERGARFETGVEVTGITTDRGEVRGVRTDGGHVEAGTVVCAAGWRTRDLLLEHVEVPLRPFRWQHVNLEVEREVDEDFPMGWDWSVSHDESSAEDESRRYWRPELNGELHVGGGTYFVDDPGDVRESATEAFRNKVAEVMRRRLQGMGNARIVSDDSCPTGDAATPDDMPIIDEPREGPDGLVVAVMGPVGGIMGSPFVARAVHSLVTGEEAPFALDPHRLDRFEDRSDDFDCWYVTGWSAPGD